MLENQTESVTRPRVKEEPRWLFVDLDGTLLNSDLLWEAMAELLRSSPIRLLLVPFWLLSGRASFKQRMTECVQISPESLPFRESVLERIKLAHLQGRSVILASASPYVWVRAISDYLGHFDGVLGSDEDLNLKGERKLAAIRELVAGESFEYVGDCEADVPIWKAADLATLVHSDSKLMSSLSGSTAVHLLEEPRPGGAAQLLRALRPHQWAKNVLVFAPLLLAHEVFDAPRVLSTVLAFIAFCCVASVGYVLNDLMDLKSDRQHPDKRTRPLASGSISVASGFTLWMLGCVFFLVFSVLFLDLATTAMLMVYLGLTMSYSLYFKKLLLLDALLLAGLYGHRILTGGVAGDVTVSPWLLVFSGFLFLSLALVKRYSELRLLSQMGEFEDDRRAYRYEDISAVEILGVGCGLLSVLVLCLYVSSDGVAALYPTPVLLWFMVPVMFFWISRIWMLAQRGDLPGDPVLFAIRDRSSYVCGVIMLLSAFMASLH
ncbi:MAG: hypothetical protein CL917_05640 [Deltaproteobacteria bacterium]|nr:hypothetical protein [Deltaproteobacteria bacterium]